MENKNIIYIVGGGIALVVLFVVMRGKGGGSPTVIQTGGGTIGSGDNGIAAQLASQKINADVFTTLAAGAFGESSNRLSTQLGLTQITASRDVGLAQTSVAGDVARAQNTTALAAVEAGRQIGLANANADLSRARLENEALANQLRNQNTSNALSGLLSQLGNILRGIGAQPTPPRPSSSGGSSGASGGASGGSPSATRPTTRQPTQPRTPPFVAPDLFDAFGLGNLFPEIPFFGNFDFGDFNPGDFTDVGSTMGPTQGDDELPFGQLTGITELGEADFNRDFGEFTGGLDNFEDFFGPPPDMFYGGEGLGGFTGGLDTFEDFFGPPPDMFGGGGGGGGSDSFWAEVDNEAMLF